VQRVWTVSNITSISRIIFVLPAAYCLMADFTNHREWALAFILMASITDFLDGYLARRLHQVTDLGKIIDPLADKIGIGIVAVCLLLTGDIPLWYLVVVLARDILIFLGGVYINHRKGIVPQSNMAGKIAVNLIAIVLILSLLRIPSLHAVFVVMIWLSIVVMLISVVIYAKRLFIGLPVTPRS
jgi:CDP-diacylglycerol--glycerol-3-phosphate 3-phosphatidyltransferase